MKSFLSRKLAIGATGSVLLAGAGGAVAVAATQSGSGRQAYIDDVAKHLNVSPSALTAAIKAAQDEQIEAAVAAGHLTQPEADALKQRIQQSGSGPFFGRGFGFGRPHRFGGPGGFGVPGGPGGFGGGGVGVSAAQYLGISQATLQNDLKSGKSLAQIAASIPGKSVEGLEAAVTAQEKTLLAKAVSSGWITSQDEQERLADFSSHIGALLQRTGVVGPNGGPGTSPNGGPGGGPYGGPGGGPYGGPGGGPYGGPGGGPYGGPGGGPHGGPGVPLFGG